MELKMNKDISVLMSVYKNDLPQNVRVAVESVVNQTLKPKQIVIAVDGPIPEQLDEELKRLVDEYPSLLEVHYLKENVGLGKALQAMQGFLKYDFVARMDSDDISRPERFEKQIQCFENDPQLDVVSSNSQEFFNQLDNIAGLKIMPEKHEDIVKLMSSRCPLIHPAMMMKKQILEKSGGYLDWFYAEDWYLIIRMYLAGAKFYNIQDVLLDFRVNTDTYGRRGGIKYYKSIKGLLKIMRKHKMMGFFKYNKEKLKRFVAHVLIPTKLRQKLYIKVMRKEVK